ncbi:sensor histidine kinase [Tistlia consotensis]|nr:sensor histidine kinase [Tistlia consotensis]
MRIRSLRVLIIGSLVTIHVAVTCVFLLAAGRFAAERQRDYARIAMAGTVTDVTNQAVGFLERLSRVALLTRGLAEAEVVRTEQLPQLERYFFEVLKANPEITGVYYGTRTGDFTFVTREAPGLGRNGGFFSRSMVAADGGRRSVVRLRNPDFSLFSETELDLRQPFDPRRRPWFQLALRADGVVWTQPYLFYTAGTPGISTATRVDDAKGSILGVVGADISLGSLQSFVDRLTVGETGYAFLLDPYGRAISHPALVGGDHSAPPLAPVGTLGDPALGPLADRLVAGDDSFQDPVEVEGRDGRDYFVVARRLPTRQGDWTIGAVVPDHDLFGWFGELSRMVILLSLGLTLIWCLAGVLLWRLIDRRFERLRALADRVLGRTPKAGGTAPARGFSELAQTERAVERALAELDRQRLENLRLLEEARRSDRAKTLFLASMSHELRTPLNAIGGFAEIIERELLGPVGVAKYREYAQLIGRSNRRMLELVENLLDASALEFGTMELHPAPAEFDRLAVEAAEEQRLQATRRGLKLEVEADSGVTALVDAPKVRMLLANLLRNALAYTPPGGSVSLQVATTADGEPLFRVADTGIGMEPEKLEQLRKPFARGLDNSYVAGETGTGLGLAIVDRIANLHGARLQFETAPGDGTRISVTFPRDCVLERTGSPAL